ncbi:imidazole glycerol phosphate synthase subunit HisH [Microbacter margulisiae]|uniref:Imidazole glycerol phosphate synthase subunit HisH n=1 Tax=Microbacter margulisiae TaxID=1350067 RepID=A0A7W5DQP9_9PORP|nr:imidazole glycerol phosphate synthase subunit HisH [Microbacter margulisiae]MBB3187256.1 glutamine amidotransferase [Microbacter margulisiae]
MNIVIIKYNAGNIRSVLFALERLGYNAEVTDDPALIRKADKVIFPGVGEASTAMNYLQKHDLDHVIRSLKQPVLGICLGMQLLCRFSEENQTNCLGIIDQPIKRFPSLGMKIPQIGWNDIYGLKGPIFQQVPEHSYVYFVHGFYAPLSEYTIASANYMVSYSAALQQDNFFAVQFHPEKSGVVGEQILTNFLQL